MICEVVQTVRVSWDVSGLVGRIFLSLLLWFFNTASDTVAEVSIGKPMGLYDNLQRTNAARPIVLWAIGGSTDRGAGCNSG